MAITVIISAVTGAICTILTLVFTKGVEAWRHRTTTKATIAMDKRKQEMDESSRVFEEAKKAYELLIEKFSEDHANLKQEVRELRSSLDKVESQHTECLIVQESLRGDIKRLQGEVARLQKHDEATEAQVRMNMAAVRKIAPELLPADSLPPSAPGIREPSGQ